VTAEEFIADFRELSTEQLKAALELHLDLLAMARRTQRCGSPAWIQQGKRVNAIRRLLREREG
jgi:hypothetical protein